MNIFGVGGAELVLIIVIMLVVAGPKRMIRWMYILGQWVGRFRVMWSQVVDVMEKEMRDAGMDVDLPRDIPNRGNLNQWANQLVKPYADELEQEFNEAAKPVREIMKETNAVMKDADKSVKDSTAGMGSWAAKNGTVKPTKQTATSDAPQPATPTNLNGNGSAASANESNFGAWSNPQSPAQQAQQQSNSEA